VPGALEFPLSPPTKALAFNVIGEVAEQPAGDVSWKPLGEHGATNHGKNYPHIKIYDINII